MVAIKDIKMLIIISKCISIRSHIIYKILYLLITTLAFVTYTFTVQLTSKLTLVCAEHACVLQFLSSDSVQTHI